LLKEDVRAIQAISNVNPPLIRKQFVYQFAHESHFASTLAPRSLVAVADWMLCAMAFYSSRLPIVLAESKEMFVNS
jgi:hypothetical protein